MSAPELGQSGAGRGEVEGLTFDGHRLIGPARVRFRAGVITSVEALPLGPQPRTILPGLIDGHLHLTSYAESLISLDLSGLAPSAIVSKLADADRRTAPGRWIRAHGVLAASWPEVADRAVLDRVTGQPCVLWATDLHRLVLNSLAIAHLGVETSASPDGGRIVRDQNGAATGVLEEKAAQEFSRRIPPLSSEEMRQAIGTAIQRCQAAGLVGAASYETAAALQELAAMGANPSFALRLFQYSEEVSLTDRPGSLAAELPIIGVKLFLDGTLGSRTAWMKEPFSDFGGHGIRRMPEDAPSLVSSLRQRGYTVSLHAIGDAAFSAALDLLAGEMGRIEHIQLVDPADLDRITPQLIASVQPAHLVDDRDVAEAAWGVRIRYAYPYRSLWQHGATLVFGSDAPVVPPDPLVGLKMAVDRRLGDEALFGPDQALPLEVALAAYTSGPARTLGIGSGAIAPGLPATLTVVEGDLSHEAGRRAATIGATVVAGEAVYGRLP